MKKLVSTLLVAALVGLPTLLVPARVHADDTTTDQDRIKNAGVVLKEIMDIPDDIPQDVIDKADCVDCVSLGSESGVHRRRQLRTRRDDLPQRRRTSAAAGERRA